MTGRVAPMSTGRTHDYGSWLQTVPISTARAHGPYSRARPYQWASYGPCSTVLSKLMDFSRSEAVTCNVKLVISLRGWKIEALLLITDH